MAKAPYKNKDQEAATAFQQLKADLKEKRTQRLYFFHGEETFLLHHYLNQLQKLLLEELTESFNFHQLNSENFDLQRFGDAVENLPMMAEHTLVWVDEVDIFRIPEGERDRLAEIISDIPEYCTVVFTYVTVPWKPDSRLGKYWTLIKSKGQIVEFAKQEPRDLIPWVGRHFAREGKRIATNLCAYLIDITGGTMTALAGEISKICAYSGATEIKKEDIDAVTEPVLDAMVFDMTDLLSRGAYGPALLKLEQLLQMQEEPVVVLGAIGAHLRRISLARSLLDCGKNAADMVAIAGGKDYAARKAMEAARGFSAARCRRAAGLVMETDRKIKTSQDRPERLLETLLMELAQEDGRG